MMTALNEAKTANGTRKIGALSVHATGQLEVQPNRVQRVDPGIDQDLRGNADFLFLKLSADQAGVPRK